MWFLMAYLTSSALLLTPSTSKVRRPTEVSAYWPKGKMRFQSFAMLITTQPSLFA
jgi:hypothetical protein